METKKTKLKARRMYINPGDMIEPYAYLTSYRDSSADRGNTLPVAVIPLDDVPALVEKAMNGFRETDSMLFSASMYGALAAIGVLPKSRKGRK